MATLSLNNTLSALRAARSLQTATADVSSLFERLSSGTRINHASDDPAGLAEASTLRTAGRVYTQATRNINDSISFFNVADSATSALKNVLDRLSELATQASNGVLSDPQRQALDQESQALQAEYARVLDTANYNGTNVFAAGDLATQAGFGAQAVILANISSGSNTTLSTTNSTTTTTGDGTFQAKQTFTTGLTPYSVTVADLNGDGKSDLVSADSVGNTASVMLGNGNGSFQARHAFATGGGPMSIAVADYNGDGKSDLVSADVGDDRVSVLLGNGNGTFQARGIYVTGISPYDIVAADFNGDGKMDLVDPNRDASTVSVLIGNGNGTFQAKHDYTASGTPQCIAVTDFDGDGKSDLVTTNYTGNAAIVLLGNGNGTFLAQRSYVKSTHPNGVQVGDFNGDGQKDIVAVEEGPFTLGVLLGNGNGTFQTRRSYAGGTNAMGVAVADFNGDGISDLANGNYFGADGMSVLLGNGNGTFQARHGYTGGNGPNWIVVGDLNGDGVSDLATADYDGNSTSVFLGNGTTQTTTKTTTVTTDCLQPITGVSLATQDDAITAQAQIQGYQNGVSVVAGAIGAVLSRFQVAVDLTSSTADTYRDAESRITDIDVATDVASLVREQIVQQAATAMLAQANQQPALALTLLR